MASSRLHTETPPRERRLNRMGELNLPTSAPGLSQTSTDRRVRVFENGPPAVYSSRASRDCSPVPGVEAAPPATPPQPVPPRDNRPPCAVKQLPARTGRLIQAYEVIGPPPPPPLLPLPVGSVWPQSQKLGTMQPSRCLS